MNEQQAKCDVCNATIEEPEGYILVTAQIVRSQRFWLDYYRRHQKEFEAMGIASYDAFLGSPAADKLANQVSQEASPWLVCKQCIHLFQADEKQAWVYARHWWESKQTFTPPDTGPAPLSAVRMAEGELPPRVEEAVPEPVPEEEAKERELPLTARMETTDEEEREQPLTVRMGMADREEEVQPPPGAPRWPPVVAMLNLTGLGLGYLYMKRWLRWLIHFAITVGLITTAFLANAARLPALWAIVFGMWLFWMTLDGWWQARRQARAAPAGAVSQSWLILLLALFLIALMAGIAGGYAILGQRAFSAGMTAYREADCRTAMQHFNRVTSLYELTLSPNVAAAEAQITECSLLVFAENRRAEGEHADAVSAYQTYLHLYPESEPVAFTQDALAETYGEWAAALREEGEYQTALEKYQIVLNDYPESPTGEEAASQAAETYAEWAAQLREEGQYEEAIQKQQSILNEYPDTAAGGEAVARAAETYAEWALDLREDGEFEQAIEKYEIILADYPETSSAAEAEETAAETYAQWATQLRESGDYEKAIEKYEIILEQYPDAPAAADIEEITAQAYAEWASELREAEFYSVAIGKYRILLREYSDTEPASTAQLKIGQTYNEWADALRSDGKYTEAMEKFELAKEATDDPDVIAAAEEGYDEALWGLSQDTTGEGKELMSQILPTICEGESADSPAVGLAEDEPGKALFGGGEFKLPNDLVATHPGHFQYAVCLETGNTVLQRCPYTGGHTLIRQRRWWRVYVRDTATGNVVTNRTFQGSSPGSCPFSHMFFGSTDYMTGGSPSSDQVVDWLEIVLR